MLEDGSAELRLPAPAAVNKPTLAIAADAGSTPNAPPVEYKKHGGMHIPWHALPASDGFGGVPFRAAIVPRIHT